MTPPRGAPPTPPASLEVQPPIELTVSGVYELEPSGFARIAVSEPDIADIKMGGGGRLRVIGVAPGRTTLMAFLKNGDRRSWVITVHEAATPP